MGDIMEVTASIDREEWSEFVFEHPHGNIFQTPEMREVYEQTKNYEPITLSVVDGGGEILALVQAVVIREMGGFPGSFSARAIVQGGPLFVDDKNGASALEMLMEYYDKMVHNKALYTQIRNMWDTSNISNFLNSTGYEYEEHLNFLVDLTIPADVLWKKLFKSRRNGINKAKRYGVIVEEVAYEDLITVVYDRLQETYKKAKLPLDDISLVRHTFDILAPKNMAKFFLAKYEDKYIGTIVILMYKGVIYDWYAGSSGEYLRLCPNDMLPWYVMEMGSNNGYHTFDFGGAGKPEVKYGVREFKRQFGGDLVNYGRYKKIYSPLKVKIAEKGFEVYRKMML